ncbi:MAG: hypothetical protein ACI8WB_005078 [Phenylobacterium sp.]|jgi:hypothetical protein
MNFLKKSLITVVGGSILLIVLVVAILPGTLLFVLPFALGALVLLSLEYPQARKVLRKLQRWMSVAATKLDQRFR